MWFLLAFVLFLACALLIIAEVFIPSGGLISILALASAIGGIIVCFSQSLLAGWIGLIFAIIMIPGVLIIAYKVLPKTRFGKQVILSPPERQQGDAIPDTSLHLAHFHTTRGWGLANVLAALQAGITRYESTLGGIGGQPANFVSGIPVSGTGKYYYKDPNAVGLVSTEDMLVMMDEMGIETGIDIDRILEIGKMTERIVGRRLRSESINMGRIPKELTGRK